MQCIKSKTGVSLNEFRDHWKKYEEEFRAVAEAIGAVRVTLSTTLAVKENVQIMTTRKSAWPYEGVAELLVERADELEATMEQADVKAAIEAMQAHQKEFVDIENSCFFFTMENVIFDLTGGGS